MNPPRKGLAVDDHATAPRSPPDAKTDRILRCSRLIIIKAVTADTAAEASAR